MTKQEIEAGIARLKKGFVVPQIWQDTMLNVETNCGTETIPDEFGNPADHWDDEIDRYTAQFVDEVLSRCEGKNLISVERVSGCFARLSAPGYLDCTDTAGPFDSEDAAAEYLVEMYDDGFDDEAEDA